MRISDWSSAVCSSDLKARLRGDDDDDEDRYRDAGSRGGRLISATGRRSLHSPAKGTDHAQYCQTAPCLRHQAGKKIGTSTCKERGCKHVYISLVAVSSKTRTYRILR